MYGLLEPFETLGQSQLLTPQEGSFMFGMVSSMVMVVGVAVSLIRLQLKKPHLHAVVFALLLGCALSLYNVLQRKSHMGRPTTSTTTTTPNVQTHLEKMERSVIQFTQLSFRSALLVCAVALALIVSWFPYN
jgi:hypothetical protein